MTSRDPENYRPVEVTVDFDGVVARAWTYVGRDDAAEGAPATTATRAWSETHTGDDSLATSAPYAYLRARVRR